MKVLYVSHTGLISGGERSLLDTVAALPPDVEAVLATPSGPLADTESLRTIEIPALDAHLSGSAIEGVRSLRHAARVLRNVTRREAPDVVHANSIRAGLVACTASLDAPVLVSVRDRLPGGMKSLATKRVIQRRADLVVANSHHTLAAFGRGIVIHPGIDLSPYDALPAVDEARRAVGVDAAPILGVVAQITPWKAQDDAIRILAGIRGRHPNAALLVVGAVTFTNGTHDNVAFEASLHELAARLRVDDAVHFLGARSDIPVVMRALDVLLVPSWDEPFGRTVVEALAAGVPVAATSVGGPAEILAGTDGVLLPPCRPDEWVGPIFDFLEERRGTSTRQAAARAFAAPRQVEELVRVYRGLVTNSLRTAA